MKYKVEYATKFRRQYKRLIKRGYNMDLLKTVVDKLANGEKLEPKHRDHALSGNWIGFRECHIAPDWLLVYQKIDNEELLLVLARLTSHSDLSF